MTVLKSHYHMELDLWFSADSLISLGSWVYLCQNSYSKFFFHQMGLVTNKMHQIRF